MNDGRMFERRLKALVALFTAALVIILARLFQLQVVAGDYYQQRAEQSMISAPAPLPFVRGSILDRTGEAIVCDHATWDVTVDFDVLAWTFGDEAGAKRQLARRWKRYYRQLGEVDIEGAIARDIRSMWGDFALFVRMSGDAPINIKERARELYDKVVRVRQAVTQRRGFDAPVAEERLAHAIVEDIGPDEQIAARELFAGHPWVHIEPSSTRRFSADATALAHVIGRLGNVDADAIADDPEAESPFASYQTSDVLGINGVEWLAERRLRGRRGQLTTDRDGNVLEEIEAENGEDVRLTIHAGLQQRLYELLGETVRENRNSSGGAIVVLDVESREVLALVSYPAYDPNLFQEQYEVLRDDIDRLPLLFRAVATRYAPGSTIKPLTCLAGLVQGAIGVDSRETCTGYLFEDVRDAWRCWQVHGTDIRKAHGPIDVVGALTGSCNVFMYRVGERLGVDRLCSAFDMAGIGRATGIGLREEVKGINPTPSYLMSEFNRTVTPGMARNYAIGQGEMAATPLQVANLMATYASGNWKPTRLIQSSESSPEWRLPGEPEDWRAIRRGIYGVTNDSDGTAYKYAHFEQDGWVLCGKTGSATAHPWPTSYRIPYTDPAGHKGVAVVREGAAGPAIERFQSENSSPIVDVEHVEVATRWPPYAPEDGENHSHAWFGGFLQAISPGGEPDFSRQPPIAFAVLVEFGGSGGQVSGPLAKKVAVELLPFLQVASQ